MVKETAKQTTKTGVRTAGNESTSRQGGALPTTSHRPLIRAFCQKSTHAESRRLSLNI